MGVLISICGLDGSGKTTQGQLLNSFFTKRGYKSVMLHTKYLQIDKSIVMRKTLDFMRIRNVTFSESILKGIYAAFSFDFLVDSYILKELKENDFVILDRYIETQYCMYKINAIESDFATNILDTVRKADIAFFLDVSPEVCYKRIESRGRSILFHESIENLKIAYDFYKQNKNVFNFCEINANAPMEVINKEIINQLIEFKYVEEVKTCVGN